MQYPVKHISSELPRAPALGPTAGSLVTILDALLCTGWGSLTATSGSISGGIATLNFAEVETFRADEVVLIQGADPAALNGEARVLTQSANKITVATSAADGPISGTVTVKYAPAGWEIVFSGTNKRAYRPTSMQAPPWLYWVDDTQPNYARWCIYESMSDVDTGAGRCPTDAQMPGGGYMVKWSIGSPAMTYYHAAADALAMLIVARNGPYAGTNTSARIRGFGMPVRWPSGGAPSPWSAFISCGSSNSGGYGFGALGESSDGYMGDATGGMIYRLRAANGNVGAVAMNTRAVAGGYNGASGDDGTFGALSAQPEGRLLLSPIAMSDMESLVPGVLSVPQAGAYSAFAQGAELAGAGLLAGRRLLAVRAGSRGTNNAAGVCFVDLTGSWR